MTLRNSLVGLISLGCVLVVMAPGQAGQLVNLGQGHFVEIIGIDPINFTNGPPALVLRYQTTTRVTNLNDLRVEANRMWSRFVLDAEQLNYQSAIISANESGGIKGYNFGFVKQNGSWRALEDEIRDGLTDSFVRSFIERVDRLYELGYGNALMLYLADTWTADIKSQVADMGTATIDRAAMTRGLRHPGALTHTHRRRIVGIKISDDRRSALAESEEIETVAVNGQQRTMTSRSIDAIKLEDRSVVLANSAIEIRRVD